MSAPDSSARLLLASLNHVPRAEVAAYVADMYIESADKVRFLVGWYGGHAPFQIYVSSAALRASSNLFATDGARSTNGPATVSPYSFHFHEVDGQAAVVFGLWLGLHTANYNESVYDSFDGVIRFKFERSPGLLADCWKIAEDFESQPFKNYLITTIIDMADDDFEVLIGEAERFARRGYDGTGIVGALIENMAFVYVEHDLNFTDMLRDWMRRHDLMSCGPILLNDFLYAVEELAGLESRGLPYHPLQRICVKWHKHRNMEERMGCHDFDAYNDIILDQSDHGDNGDDHHDGHDENGDDDSESGGSESGPNEERGDDDNDDTDDNDDGGDNGDGQDQDQEEEAGNDEPNSGPSGGHQSKKALKKPRYYEAWELDAQKLHEARRRVREAAEKEKKRNAEAAGLDDDNDGKGKGKKKEK
ncbi:hypothetical protein AYL99_00291 [Fonsecaea erecta]|uniref:Uncharacterized protein n=1 Tax=Fonsecaea erecta TaxID=1367422 RepID=A0A178ZWX0_9EURO|nr:hypothetical protein AYL99_00291 [Fonsecaea erecta]OAP64319.1 hypothetical protein AYL99_00291 [Fonsecaea erecta]